MNKRFLSFAVAATIAASLSAIPAKPGKHKVIQPDGTELTIMVRGDENFHFICTEDGLPVVKDVNGTYCYATLSTDKKIVATTQEAHNIDNRSAKELNFLKGYNTEANTVRSLGKERTTQRNMHRIERLAKRGIVDRSGKVLTKDMSGAWGGEGIGVTGKRKGLVILVNFKDVKMQSKHTQEEWKKYFNEEGYNKNGNSGSVHDYFKAQSYGQFDLEFDVVGPVTVSKNMAAYGSNDENGDDKDPGGMVYEACKLADPQVNFADYDWDGDGEVDQVYLVYAGYGEAATYPLKTDNIWQHEWNLDVQNYSLYLDGVKINTYGCSSELNGNYGTDMDGIGTACHEFSHCMGIPDLYDTMYSGNFGMGSWDIMDTGSYGGDGYKPVGYNTYEKWVSGWMQPTELKSACYVKDLKPLSESPESYIIYNEKTPTEYYLLENRQLSGNDTELPGHGLLVIHIDYDKSAWNNNTINNYASHQRFTIVPADNKLTDKTLQGDPYPGTSMNTQLTDTSIPAAKLFNSNTDGRKYLGKPVTDIAEQDRMISFTFMGGASVETPGTTAPAKVTDDGFILSWGNVEDADSYNVELRKKSENASAAESIKIEEDFTTWGKGFKGDGTTDISSQLNTRMKNPGWTGYKVYECPNRIKLGSSKANGYITSPLISDISSASVTVRLQSEPYGNDAAKTKVSILDSQEKEVDSKTFDADGSMATIVLDNASGNDYKVKVSPSKRGYIEKIAIYDGEFDSADFDAASAPEALYVMRASNTQQISGITENSYTFKDMEYGTYQWRVQAVLGNATSKWTSWQTIEFKAPTGIESTLTGFDSETLFGIYTTAGTYVGRMTYADFIAAPLATGVYILKNGVSTMQIAK